MVRSKKATRLRLRLKRTGSKSCGSRRCITAIKQVGKSKGKKIGSQQLMA